jgi:TRAP-type C4-dicarboxylate transport system substrate-binding protein
MKKLVSRRAFTVAFGAVAVTAMTIAASLHGAAPAAAADKIVLRLSTPATETDQRSKALAEVFGPAVSEFAEYQPNYNATLFKQGTELEAIARGNLEMSITSAQELATIFPEFSIFTAGYLHQNAAHQVRVFNDPLMAPLKEKVEAELGVKLLSVMYLGRRQVNLRMPKSERAVMTPADLAGVKLRMPGTDAWQFLGKALGADPLPMAFTEVYTALQTGAIDGQDNPLPTNRDSKFYEVTKQIVLTSHLVDLNYIAFSKKVWDGLTAEQQATVQKAADDAAELGRQRQLALEEELAQFFRDNGLEVYEPDVKAFREAVQKAYMGSEFAKSWVPGMVDQINALGD